MPAQFSLQNCYCAHSFYKPTALGIAGTDPGILATEGESKMADASSPNPSSEPEKLAPESSDSSAAELQKTISDAFDIFDHESNKTVDVRYQTSCKHRKRFCLRSVCQLTLLHFSERLEQL